MKFKERVLLLFLLSTTLFTSCISEQEGDLVESCDTSDLTIEVLTTSPITCQSQGSIEVSATGGAGVFEFSIDETNYQANGLFENLNAGSYTLIVKDANGCMVSITEEITQSDDAIALSVTSSTPSTCGQSDGAFVLSGSGGEGTLLYKIGNGEFQASSAFTGLISGEYDIEVKDDGGCFAFLSVTVEESSGDLVLTVSDIEEAGCGTATGSVTLAANGGDDNYQYKLEDGALQTSATFSGLSSGDYDFSVIDGNTCETTVSAEVLPPSTLSGDVFSIVSSNCASSGCHGGRQSPDLVTSADIIQSAGRVKARTTAKTMPPGGGLSQAQIDAIACWVDDGAKDN